MGKSTVESSIAKKITNVWIVAVIVMVMGINNACAFDLFDSVTKAFDQDDDAGESTSQVDSAVTTINQSENSAGDDLTTLLTDQLGITQPQAEGGAGSIFSFVKQQVDPAQFAELAKGVPNMNSLLKAAPAADNDLSSMAGAFSGLGEHGESAGQLLQLGSAFKSLDLSPEMVQQFVPVISNYLKSGGNEAAANLLTGLF